MGASLLKFAAVSIVALGLAAHAFAAPSSGGYAPSRSNPSGGAIWIPGPSSHVGAPPSHGNSFPREDYSAPNGAKPQETFVPPAGASPLSGVKSKGNSILPSGVSQFAGPRRHEDLAWLRRHHRGRGVTITPGVFGYDDYDNGEYDYDDNACWVYRRAFNRYGRSIGWRRIDVCQGVQ